MAAVSTAAFQSYINYLNQLQKNKQAGKIYLNMLESVFDKHCGEANCNNSIISRSNKSIVSATIFLIDGGQGLN